MHQRDSCLACLQFRSISYGLFGTEAYHKAVRRKAVQYLREHRSDFEAFLGDDFDHYLKDMSHNDTWGDELTLVSVHPSKWQCQACLVCSNYPMHDRTISHSVLENKHAGNSRQQHPEVIGNASISIICGNYKILSYLGAMVSPALMVACKPTPVLQSGQKIDIQPTTFMVLLCNPSQCCFAASHL